MSGAPARARLRVATLVLAVLAAPAAAEELSIDTSVLGRFEYNDNVPLSVVPQAAWRFQLAPDLTLSRRAENGKMSFSAGAAANRYTVSSLNTTDYHLALRLSRQLEVDEVTLDTQYRRESTLGTQLTQTGVNAGRTQVGNLVIAPQWRHALDEQWSTTVSASYAASNYAQTAGSSLVDYRNAGGSVGLRYAATERIGIDLTAAYSSYDTDPFTTRSESWSASAALTWLVNEQLTLNLNIGAQRVRTVENRQFSFCPAPLVLCVLGLVAPVQASATAQSVSTTVPYGLSLVWQIDEVQVLSLGASRDVSPSGVGTLVSSARFSGSYSRALAPNVSASLVAVYSASDSLDGVALGRFYSLAPTLEWTLDEAWKLTAGYVYSNTRFGEGPATAHSNAVFATATYSWPLWTGNH